MTDTNTTPVTPDQAGTGPAPTYQAPAESSYQQPYAQSAPAQPAHVQQAYPEQQHYAQPAPPVYIIQKPPATKKGFGLTSMILGISAVVFSWTTVFAFIMLILAFIFGVVSLKKKESPRGFAITGLILGSAAVLLVILFAVVLAALFGAASSFGVSSY